MIYKFLNKLQSRTIYRSDGSKYLTRYYIFRKPKKMKWLPSIYIHKFHSSDADSHTIHNHEWNFSFSIILKGSYQEEYRDMKTHEIKTRILSSGCFNFIPADKFHRIDLITPSVWTLFVSGSKSGQEKHRWGFIDKATGEYTDWEIFTKQSSSSQ